MESENLQGQVVDDAFHSLDGKLALRPDFRLHPIIYTNIILAAASRHSMAFVGCISGRFIFAPMDTTANISTAEATTTCFLPQ
jgi:hypothetical protein